MLSKSPFCGCPTFQGLESICHVTPLLCSCRRGGKHLRFSDDGEVQEVVQEPGPPVPLPRLPSASHHLYGRMHPDRLKGLQKREEQAQAWGNHHRYHPRHTDEATTSTTTFSTTLCRLSTSLLPRCLVVPPTRKARIGDAARGKSSGEGAGGAGTWKEVNRSPHFPLVSPHRESDTIKPFLRSSLSHGPTSTHQDQQGAVEGLSDKEEEEEEMWSVGRFPRGKDYEVVAVAGEPSPR